jgi:hypothetical protein
MPARRLKVPIVTVRVNVMLRTIEGGVPRSILYAGVLAGLGANGLTVPEREDETQRIYQIHIGGRSERENT